MRLSLVTALLLLTGCASAPLGRVARFEVHGQQVICWEPSKNLNGLTAFVANRLEDR